MGTGLAAPKALPPKRQEELAEYLLDLAEEPAPYRLTGEGGLRCVWL
jgi:hypothetical protein